MKQFIHSSKCKLWNGSLISTQLKFCHDVPRSVVEQKILQLSYCDDRTQNEDEWIAALKKDLAEDAKADNQ